MIAIEQCYADSGEYPAEILPSQQATVTIACGGYPEHIHVTDGNRFAYTAGGSSGYTITVTDAAGGAATYHSSTGTITTS